MRVPGADSRLLEVPGGRVRVEWAAHSDRGSVRQLNEDAFIAAPPVWLVADGMGGHEHGDRASAAVAGAFGQLAARPGPVDPQSILETINEANDAVLAIAGRGLSGTTLTGVALVAIDAATTGWMVFNIGDSRTYRYVGRRLEQLSVDHSAVQELVDLGVITRHEAERHPDRNVVTRALGADVQVDADVWIMPARGRERFLLCSDGLTKELPDSEIARVVAFHDAQVQEETTPELDVASRLVGAAVAAGGRDNVTVVSVDGRFESDAPQLDDTLDRLPGMLEDTRPRA